MLRLFIYNIFSYLNFVVLLCSAISYGANDIVVTYIGGYSCEIVFQQKKYKCSLGKNGISYNKIEGDGCTPAGTFPLRQAFYRADRIGTAQNMSDYLAAQVTMPDFAWCDDVTSEFYNLFVNLPFSESHENLWLENSTVYDLLAVVGYNDCPVVKGMGSAIFFHVTESYGPTAGCVAVNLEDLKYILQNVDSTSMMVIS
jgi:L,D-peptidoglycan transpeptidase YkuD (ErfK/YbiS/YcfS/YnhG family)